MKRNIKAPTLKETKEALNRVNKGLCGMAFAKPYKNKLLPQELKDTIDSALAFSCTVVEYEKVYGKNSWMNDHQEAKPNKMKKSR